MDVIAIVLGALFGIIVSGPVQLAVRRAPFRLRMTRLVHHCGNCGVAVASGQRHPLRTYVERSNACSNCGEKIWESWPWIELSAVALLAIVGWRAGWSAALPAYLVYFGGVLALTIIDFRHYLLPNKVVYPTLFLCAALLLPAAVVNGFDAYGEALIGMVGSFVFFYITHIISPRSMGYGDVRLAGLNGLMMGWLGVGNVVLGVMLGLVSASFIGLALMALRRRSRKDPIPFGPFLMFGSALAILAPSLFTGGTS
jgi:leader peptidase (prepilin peptidase)/N-methyltransferase